MRHIAVQSAHQPWAPIGVASDDASPTHDLCDLSLLRDRRASSNITIILVLPNTKEARRLSGGRKRGRALSAMAFPQASTARELLKLQPLKEFAAVVNNVFSVLVSCLPGASGQEWSKGRVCCPRHASVKLEQASRYRLGAVFRVCTKGTLERSRRLRTSLRPSLRGSRLSNPRQRIQETRWRRSRLCALSETGVQCWI
jgi:hypothetical protein